MRAGNGGDGPGKGPAVAVEHRQGPEIDRMPVEAEGDRVAESIQIGAAMVIDDAFRVAGGARGVVERDGGPFVGRRRPGRGRIALAKKILVLDAPPGEHGRLAILATGDLDQRQFPVELGEGRFHDRAEFAVGDQQFRLAVRQDEGDRARVEPVVQRIQHRAGHRHAVMRFEQCRHVRRHHRDGVAGADAAPAQRIGEAPAAGIEFVIGKAALAPGFCRGRLDHGEFVGVDRGRPRQETKRGQGREIGGVAGEIGCVVRLLAHAGILMEGAPRDQRGRRAWSCCPESVSWRRKRRHWRR